VERWRGGEVEWWSDGEMEWWSGGVVEWWSGGVVEWWSGGVVEWWSGGVVDSKNLRLGHFGDLRCGQRRIFGPTGHGNLAPSLPWEPFYNASSPEGAKVLCRRSNLRSACPDAPTIWRRPKKNSPRVNFGLRFSFSPSFGGGADSRKLPGSSNAVLGLRPQELH
jgi:hypothetical protein